MSNKLAVAIAAMDDDKNLTWLQIAQEDDARDFVRPYIVYPEGKLVDFLRKDFLVRRVDKSPAMDLGEATSSRTVGKRIMQIFPRFTRVPSAPNVSMVPMFNTIHQGVTYDLHMVIAQDLTLASRNPKITILPTPYLIGFDPEPDQITAQFLLRINNENYHMRTHW